jgi:hypothetical protein
MPVRPADAPVTLFMRPARFRLLMSSANDNWQPLDAWRKRVCISRINGVGLLVHDPADGWRSAARNRTTDIVTFIRHKIPALMACCRQSQLAMMSHVRRATTPARWEERRWEDRELVKRKFRIYCLLALGTRVSERPALFCSVHFNSLLTPFVLNCAAFEFELFRVDFIQWI